MPREHLHASSLYPGAVLALGSAVLFGAAAPFSKVLLASIDPQLLAGLLYAGAGGGLVAVHGMRAALGIPAPEAPLRRTDIPWLGAVVVFGGIIGPLFLMIGLSHTDAASGSLLMNLEGLATMAIAWIIFGEGVDRRLILGALAIVLGALVLCWSGQSVTLDAGAALITGACIAWGIDNNLTRKLSSADPVLIAMIKGVGAAVINIGTAAARGATFPSAAVIGGVAVLGFLTVGASLVLFILALRHLGAARTGAYFSLAPFIGAMIAIVVLGAPVTWQILAAAALMGLGLWTHLTEQHVHSHHHEALDHEHNHVHDEHHRHDHDGPVTEPHSHRHHHAPMRHRHAHYPDLHHRHDHG
ncbi:MAG: DMT family transporter [Bradyrhizobium sp.]